MKGYQELWVSTCRFQKIVKGTMDFEQDINFRIQMVDVDGYIINSRCLNQDLKYNEWKFWYKKASNSSFP